MTTEAPERRSAIMRAVRARDTRPEMLVRRAAHGLGYRFRLQAKHLPGRPDLAFPSRKKVIFVHGCFWHGHDCARGARAPKTNAEYWRRKIARNMVRDAHALAALADLGWDALVLWECELKPPAALAERLVAFLGKRGAPSSQDDSAPSGM
ncbi:very short patch repair endonuclease [Methylopila jiangsuensis]|uniref:Very short patch repair endonuclease n=1 Tax=Methylopila jiangsuensis TaxID=586230 RepID=A0A9W6N3D1_9HYPH|nr:very short patch repair endonuclease [Methylopila jiangsuensis]MDR6284273.1 DNA mismatch endonuclease (patch repair protein) [Methylopila jiangsuensis]GLK76210.1 very short patch repair endonuclease [Methylopila jiangsuensis]